MGNYTKSKDRHKSTTEEKGKIIELTPEMELATGTSGKIIRLTKPLDSTPIQPQGETPLTPSVSHKKGDSEKALSSDDFTSAAVEDEVDAAFDAVQAITPAKTPAQEIAPDRSDDLNDLTEMVDSAIREAVEPTAPATHAPKTAEDGQDEDAEEPTLELAPESETQPDNIATAEEAADAAETKTADFEPAVMPQTQEDEEEIIELTDIIHADELAAATATDDDDAIIELTEIVHPNEMTAAMPEPAAAAVTDEEDDIIELTDIVDPAEFKAIQELPAEKTKAQGDLSESADLLADPLEVDAQMPQTVAPADNEQNPLNNDQVIRLTDVLNNNRKGETPPSEDISLNVEEELAAEPTASTLNDQTSMLGLELNEITTEESAPLSDQEIEKAVERIIQTKYAETIERLISAAVEKAVKREIENIKRTFLDDLE